MDEYLPILSIETSGDLCSVCLFFNESKFVEKRVLAQHIHSEKLFVMIDEVVNEFSEQNDMKSIAVSAGPGSFTGLRIGMAAAKGIAFGKNLPIIPVPTLQATALSILPFVAEQRSFVIANCMNNDELYFARFAKKNNRLECIESECLVAVENIEKKLLPDEPLWGNYKSDEKGTFISALDVARWAYFFGKELLTFEYDYLEPNYLKNFIAKVKK